MRGAQYTEDAKPFIQTRGEYIIGNTVDLRHLTQGNIAGSGLRDPSAFPGACYMLSNVHFSTGRLRSSET